MPILTTCQNRHGNQICYHTIVMAKNMTFKIAFRWGLFFPFIYAFVMTLLELLGLFPTANSLRGLLLFPAFGLLIVLFPYFVFVLFALAWAQNKTDQQIQRFSFIAPFIFTAVCGIILAIFQFPLIESVLPISLPILLLSYVYVGLTWLFYWVKNR